MKRPDILIDLPTSDSKSAALLPHDCGAKGSEMRDKKARLTINMTADQLASVQANADGMLMSASAYAVWRLVGNSRPPEDAMRNFMFPVTDWIASSEIVLLDVTGRGCLINLLMYAWADSECAVPSDTKALRTLARATPKEWAGVCDGVIACFKPLAVVRERARAMSISMPPDVFKADPENWIANPNAYIQKIMSIGVELDKNGKPAGGIK